MHCGSSGDALGEFRGPLVLLWGSFGGALGVLWGSCVRLLELPKGTFGVQWESREGPWVVMGATCGVVPFLGRSRGGFRDFPGNSGLPFGTILVQIWVQVSLQKGDRKLIDFSWILNPFLVKCWMIVWSRLCTFCKTVKISKLARRLGESTKMEGRGGQH